jgi:hypothetical protein
MGWMAMGMPMAVIKQVPQSSPSITDNNQGQGGQPVG